MHINKEVTVLAKDLLVIGVLSGIVIEAVNELRKEDRIKNILRWTICHPGLTLSAVTALTSVSIVYASVIGGTWNAIKGSWSRLYH
jgi:hypothetical protein